MKPYHTHKHRLSQSGQSLVEFALTLPILLIILSGLMEVSSLIVTYNRTLAAAREGARIAAAGGTNDIVYETVKEASTDSLLMEPGRMEVWVVRPKVRTSPFRFDDGPGWGNAVEECVYPFDEVTGDPTCTRTSSGTDPAQVLDRIDNINTGSFQDINNERLAVVTVYYEMDSVLDLPFFSVASGANGRVPIRVYTIMRQEIVDQTVNQTAAGCSAYPIAINGAITNANGTTFLNAAEYDRFDNVLQGNTGFQYLLWRSPGGSPLSTTLVRPGDESLTEYIDSSQSTDTQIHRNDFVWIQASAAGAATPIGGTGGHVPTRRTLRVIVFTEPPAGSQVKVGGFAIVRITGNNPGYTSLNFEFVRIDTSCGYE
jgi:Flp pilus assembly protein TadG